MANVSDAFGRLTVIAKDEKTVDAIAELLSTAGHYGKYWTVFHGETDREADVEVGGAEKTFEFTGRGRGEYLYNLETLVADLKWWCGEHSREVWEKIEDEKWQLLFDYTDEDTEWGHLAKLVVLVSADGTPDGKMEILRNDEFDCTPENLVKLGVYDSVEEAKEQLCWE